MPSKQPTSKMPHGSTETECLSNLALLLREHAAARPTDTAVVAKYYRGSSRQNYTELSFAELESLSDSLAAGLLSKGVTKGTKVMLLVPPGVEFVALWFALMKIGAVTVLIDPGMGLKNLRTCISEVQPEVLISIPLVLGLSRIYPRFFSSLRLSISLGTLLHFGAIPFDTLEKPCDEPFPLSELAPHETTAITFTTGSTGVPKGVRCSQKMFSTQLARLKECFRITPTDVGFPAFLPFALYCIALGSKAVMPDINPRRPADADPEKMYQLLRAHKVNYSFGSPAFWAPLAEACKNKGRTLSLDRIIMFGAPIGLELHEAIHELFEGSGDTYTPYGATEALPVTCISGSEVITETGSRTAKGAGVCVGRVVSHTDLRILPISDDEILDLQDCEALPPYEVGEVIVAGGQVSEEYLNRPQQTALAKINDGRRIWHRMGDLGYLDDQARLWFCGRKNHRVETGEETLYSVPCESIYNQHPEVRRSALVGVGERHRQVPVICIELYKDSPSHYERLKKELLEQTAAYPHCLSIRHILFHKSFPVDFRHNAKIIREELQTWASAKIGASA